jgi:GGDEF domain-containing protein
MSLPGPPGPNGQYSNLVDEEFFRRLLHLEVQKAVRLQYCISVVVIAPDAPADRSDPALPQRIAEMAVRQLRGTDVATTFESQSMVGLLLIDADTRTLRQILNRATEAAQRTGIPAEATTPEAPPLSLSAGGSCYPETAASGRDLLRQATDLMSRAKAEGGNRLYLPRS